MARVCWRRGNGLSQVTAEAGEKKGWRGLLKEAVSGTKRDLTKGDLNSAVVAAGNPHDAGAGGLESVFSLADILWVSALGPNAVASVGLTESLMTLAFWRWLRG